MVNFFSVMYSICLIIIIAYTIAYLYLKYIKKDKRLNNIGLIKFFFNTRDVLKK